MLSPAEQEPYNVSSGLNPILILINRGIRSGFSASTESPPLILPSGPLFGVGGGSAMVCLWSMLGGCLMLAHELYDVRVGVVHSGGKKDTETPMGGSRPVATPDVPA